MKVYPNKNWTTEHGPTMYRGKFQRCSACNTMNEIGQSPEDGQWTETRRESPEPGETFGDPIYPVTGCWFCGCPLWRQGGKLGDLSRTRN